MLIRLTVVHHHMLGYTLSPELSSELSAKVRRDSCIVSVKPALTLACPASNSMGRVGDNLAGMLQAQRLVFLQTNLRRWGKRIVA